MVEIILVLYNLLCALVLPFIRSNLCQEKYYWPRLPAQLKKISSRLSFLVKGQHACPHSHPVGPQQAWPPARCPGGSGVDREGARVRAHGLRSRGIWEQRRRFASF